MRFVVECLLLPFNLILDMFNREIIVEDADENSVLVVSLYWGWTDESGHNHMDQIV